MFEFYFITKEMDRTIYREIVTYIVDNNYIYMKNNKGHVFYINKNFIREIKIKEVN